MFYFRRPESPGIQLAVSKSKQEVMPRVTSGELLPTDEIFDSEHKTWLPLYEWLAIASPAVPIQPTTETEKEHTQPHDTVLQKSQPNAAAKETILPNHKRSTSPELPSQIGRYSIIKELGSGGMGTVYKVQDEMKDERALKVMHPEFANNPTFAQMFVDEGRRARKFTVNSRRLVTTYDVGRVDDTLYLSLELVNWPTLLEVMPKIREKGWRGVVALFTEIAMGLEDLHIEKVVHRDLKPGNVFVDAESYFNSTGDKQWKVKLADFGLSGEVDETSKMATSYRAAGTAYYMAPEQRKGEHWTPASDIYSFGVMFYEALTGDIPQGMFEPASQLCKDLPTSFDELISKCLATKLENRIQNGESLAKEIKKQLSATHAKVEIPKTAQATESQSEPNLEPKSETSTQTVQNTNTTSPSAPPFVAGESKNPSTASTTSNQEASNGNASNNFVKTVNSNSKTSTTATSNIESNNESLKPLYPAIAGAVLGFFSCLPLVGPIYGLIKATQVEKTGHPKAKLVKTANILVLMLNLCMSLYVLFIATSVQQQLVEKAEKQKRLIASLEQNLNSEKPLNAAKSGEKIFSKYGCGNCHGVKDETVGPTLREMYGTTREIYNQGKYIADETYIHESIMRHAEKVRKDYDMTMPLYEKTITEEECAYLIEYIRSLDSDNKK
jgi:serine/threonine protein kinase